MSALWEICALEKVAMKTMVLNAQQERVLWPCLPSEVMMGLYAGPDGRITREAFRKLFAEAGLQDSGGILGRIW